VTDRRPVYHPRTERHRTKGRGKLRVRDATAMAVGGMIGGGIFSVLGVTIQLAGHLAFACFVLAGMLAGVTARSYAGLARSTGGSGGPDTFLRSQGHPQLAALTSWFLVLGYVLALAVYAFTFGHYVESVTGGGEVVARCAALGLMALFLAINVRGVGASSLTEDAIVFTKLFILALVAGIGMWSFSTARLEPLTNVGLGGLLIGAGSIFIAYEGFELLSYDYNDIEEPDRNLPRALYLSVALVAVVYVIVTLGSQMLVSDQLIVDQREVAFAAVGEQALGRVGRIMAVGAAVLATSSAINATLFSTSRLVRDLTVAGELPARLGRTKGDVPVTAMWLLALVGGLFAMLPGIDQLPAFGSVTFLGVFGLINHAYGRTADGTANRLIAHVGSASCMGAIVIVLAELAGTDRLALVLIAATVSVVLCLRLAYVRRHP
jgi:amino acid transporter